MAAHQQKEEAEETAHQNAENAAVEKKAVPRRKKKRRRRRVSSSSEVARDEVDMCRTVQQKYGTKRKVQDEIREALFDPNTGEKFQPSTYVRMMARSTEAHLNRLLQPEPPDDLVDSNWLCALCLKPSFADEQGELYGPYFVRLSSQCQPPVQLLATSCQIKLTVNAVSEECTSSNKLTLTKKQHSSPRKHRHSASAKNVVQGTLDIWLHGDCALWTTELFLVGGRLPTLQLHIQQYWKQKCLVCSGVGASIPITYSQDQNDPSLLATSSNKRAKTGSDVEDEHHFLHYKCASESGYRLNSLTFVCRPPLVNPANSAGAV